MHRRHQPHPVVRRTPLRLVRRTMGDVAPERGPQDQRAGRVVEGADVHQRAPDVWMHDDRVGRPVGCLRPGERAPLPAVAGVGRRVLVGDLGKASPWMPTPSRASFIIVNMARRPLSRLADEPAGRAVVVHDAGGVAVDAHLLLDGAAGDAVAPRQPSRRA